MKINFKQVGLILLLSVFCGLLRYIFLDSDYPLIKKSKLNNVDNEVDYQSINSLLSFIQNVKSPMLIDIDLAKKMYDSNLVTFIDARDTESYNEKHILNAINIPYELIDDIVYEYDLKYNIDLNDDFIEKINLDNTFFHISMRNSEIYLSSNENENQKSNAFVIYCSGEGCSLSEDLGFYMFDELNINRIFIYEGGMPEWLNNNYPVK